MPRVKTEAQERAKLRANEQRRVEHAERAILDLLKKHNIDEREGFELHMICTRLQHAIKNQHIKDERYAQYKAKFAPSDIQGDF